MTPQQRVLALLHRRMAGIEKGAPTGLPIVPSTVFHLPGEPAAPFTYARDASPTVQEAEAALGLLEEADCVLFPSGMAAIAAVLHAHLRPGDRVVFPADGYYTGRLLIEEFLAPMGVEAVFVPTREMDGADLRGARMIFLETPSNPCLDVCDIPRIAARRGGAILVVDNTAATPLLQQPLELGADLTVHAGTKALNGHSDVLAGHVAGRDPALVDPVRRWRKLAGAVPGPFEAWALHRGLETLEVRLARMVATAELLAPRLAAHPAVRALRYPGLPGDPAHSVARRQMAGFGTLIGITFADADTAERFLARAPLAQTTSFGGVHSSAERRARWGDAVPPGFVRLSVGCEPAGELWRGIAAALDALA